MTITKKKKSKYLGIDIGTKRVGIAITDSTKRIAFPYETISFKDNELLLGRIKDIILQENVEKVIIGDPVNTQGQRSCLTEKLYEVIDFLKENLNIDVELYDERYSTKIAHQDLRAINISNKKRKKIIDKSAAAIILQDYLDSN